jgi:hypothetical protein
MVASSGTVLLKKDAVEALTRGLFPLAVVVTPNVAEAEVLTQRAIRTLDDLRSAAQKLAEKYGVPFLVKGGHLPGCESRCGRFVRWHSLPPVSRQDGAEDQDSRHGMHVLGGDRGQSGAGIRAERVHRPRETICDDGHSERLKVGRYRALRI